MSHLQSIDSLTLRPVRATLLATLTYTSDCREVSRMLSLEDNELLTNTDKGTPMGDLFRRYWIPVALSEELPGPDCVPIKLKILNEDLIAYRDTSGKVGLVYAYC